MIRRDYGVTFGAIADRAGIARSTLSRYNTGEAVGLPDTTTISKIRAAFQTPLPVALEQSTPPVTGFAEAEVSPLTRDRQPFDPNRQEWIIGTESMVMHGLMKGDRIVARAGLEPQSGDIVIAQVTNGTTGRVQTVVRKYHRNMGLATLTGQITEAPRLVDGATVVVMAVMTELHRSRMAS